MIRKDREITDINEIINIIKKCDVCRLAFFDENYPYIIPMNFGYDYDSKNNKLDLYFHGAKKGKKLDFSFEEIAKITEIPLTQIKKL